MLFSLVTWGLRWLIKLGAVWLTVLVFSMLYFSLLNKMVAPP